MKNVLVPSVALNDVVGLRSWRVREDVAVGETLAGIASASKLFSARSEALTACLTDDHRLSTRVSSDARVCAL